VGGVQAFGGAAFDRRSAEIGKHRTEVTEAKEGSSYLKRTPVNTRTSAVWVSILHARATAFPLSVELDRFFDFILTSPHMDLLREYSTTTTRIGHGRRIGSVRVPDNGRRG
jgi:hypothetical protein